MVYVRLRINLLQDVFNGIVFKIIFKEEMHFSSNSKVKCIAVEILKGHGKGKY